MSRGRSLGMWRDVPGYGGRYQASRDGRVRRVYVNGTVRYLKPYAKERRRGLVVKLYRPDGRIEIRGVLSIVADTWCGGVPEGMVAAHLDGYHLDDSAENVAILTSEELGRLIGGRGNRRPVAKIDRDGNVLEVYPSARAAGRANYICARCVLSRCRGEIQAKNRYLPNGTTFVWDEVVGYED